MTMASKQQQKNAEDNAMKAEDVAIPRISSSDYMPVAFGTVKMRNPNLVAFNNAYSEKVEKNSGVWIKSNMIDTSNDKIKAYYEEVSDSIENTIEEWLD